ncbi:LysR family transcriptional regulator [Cupriavidus sp. 2TAF22]|uniref:LysR family transcriptional regulator n=1 Tax=unclassified Cupriavidus TaxID=2640874 RepID=UPI003F90BBB9
MDRLDALRLLVDVAEAGSFSAAARKRTLATSTVTLAVQQLEDELGASLITRSTRRLAFTHEGERFLAHARRLLADWDASVSAMHEDGPLRGPIRLTATNDFGRAHVVPLLDRFLELHPAVSITLLFDDSVVDLIDTANSRPANWKARSTSLSPSAWISMPCIPAPRRAGAWRP